jgi:hypothetical protein
MAAKECDCIKRDVCVFYSDGDYPQVCDKCGHYITEKGFTSTNSERDANAAWEERVKLHLERNGIMCDISTDEKCKHWFILGFQAASAPVA